MEREREGDIAYKMQMSQIDLIPLLQSDDFEKRQINARHSK
jgi:hypothetical protein